MTTEAEQIRRVAGPVKSPTGRDAGTPCASAAGDSAKTQGQPKPGEPVTPSLADGYNGASDASILERYAELITTPEQLEAGIVVVQCTERTKSLLHRAGYRRTTTFDSYQVHVIKDWMGRLQLAPLPRAEDEVAVKTLAAKLEGRKARPQRTVIAKMLKERFAVTVHRHPVLVAARYLRRFVGGYWHIGGNHVARNNYGPGIACPNFVNDRTKPIKAIAINLSAGGES